MWTISGCVIGTGLPASAAGTATKATNAVNDATSSNRVLVDTIRAPFERLKLP
jgi:hypothetical protein